MDEFLEMRVGRITADSDLSKIFALLAGTAELDRVCLARNVPIRHDTLAKRFLTVKSVAMWADL